MKPIDLDRHFGFLPQAASSLADEVDALFFTMLGLSALLLLAVISMVVIWGRRYRRRNVIDRTHRLRSRTRRIMELSWTLIPLGIFFVLFLWGGWLYMHIYTPPNDAMEIQAIGKQWMWKFQHPEGAREINELHVPLGVPVKVTLTSQDVIHSFFVPAFRVKRDAVPGAYTTAWFTATKTGEFHLYCAEYCGTDHSKMRGRVVVMRPTDYEDWLRRQDVDESLAAEGERLFRAYGCSGCHSVNADVHAPALSGIYGKPVPLASGGTKIADAAYIRDSILLPRKDVVAGFEPIMPSFAGQIEEGDILKLIAYIRSLSETDEVRE